MQIMQARWQWHNYLAIKKCLEGHDTGGQATNEGTHMHSVKNYQEESLQFVAPYLLSQA